MTYVLGTNDSPSPIDRVLAHLTQPGEESAAQLLDRYYAPGYRFTGSAFDELVNIDEPDVFTATDFLAVNALSVTVPTATAMWLLSDPEPNELLRNIPSDASLWTRPDLLDEGGAAWRLWDLIRSRQGVGRVITSKLLAAKRPHLVPVFDERVDKALQMGSSQWAFWQAVASDERLAELLDTVSRLRNAARLASVSDLRIIDVVVWSRASGGFTSGD